MCICVCMCVCKEVYYKELAVEIMEANNFRLRRAEGVNSSPPLSPRIRRADGGNSSSSPSLKAEKGWCSNSKTVRESEFSSTPPSAMDWMILTHCEEGSLLYQSPVQMLTSFRNTLTDSPRIMCNLISGHRITWYLMVKSTWHNNTILHHRLMSCRHRCCVLSCTVDPAWLSISSYVTLSCVLAEITPFLLKKSSHLAIVFAHILLLKNHHPFF